MAYLSTAVSDELMKEMAWKKQITEAKKLFEATNQAPSPSKDYVHILVTERGVVQRRFPITMRGVSRGFVPTPTERIITQEEFKMDTDFQDDIRRTFGKTVLAQVKRIIDGRWDPLSTIPEGLAVQIVSHLDLQSVAHLSQVNQHMREICNSPQLWESLYSQHQGRPTDEVQALASELGWKKVFFMNKLQLQKEVSRRRRLQQNPSTANGRVSPNLTFLTEP